MRILLLCTMLLVCSNVTLQLVKILGDTVVDPLEHDPEYTRRMMEFETTLQDKLQEELKEEERKC